MSEWRLTKYRGLWAAVRPGKGRGSERRSSGTSDRGKAEQWFADFLRANKPDVKTVGEMMDAYLADKDQTAVEPANLHSAWKQSKATFGHLRPDQVTRELCRSYRDQRYAAGKKPNTVRKELENVRAAVLWHGKSTPAVFELPSPPAAKDRTLSRQEARRLSKATRGTPHLRAFITLSLTTAARSSALFSLTWDRVDFERRIIHLPLGSDADEQMKRRARVPMNKRAYRYLRVLQATATCRFVIEWGGTGIKSVKTGFNSACARAGLKDVTPHTLRHTAGSWMAEAGVPLFDISRFMGHSTIKVTEKHYLHLTPKYLKTAAEALN